MNHFFKTSYIFLFLLLPIIIAAQDRSSQIEKLRIGNIEGSLSLSGTSLSSEIWGRQSEGHYFPWFSIFSNPAFVSGIRTPQLLFQLAPLQNYGLTKVLNLSTIVNDELDNNVKDFSTDNLQIGYPALNIQMGRRYQIPEGMLLLPVENFTLGLLFNRSLSLALDLNWIGMESSISTILNSGGSANKVVLNNYCDAVNHLDYWITGTSFFVSRVFKNRFGAGLRLERLYINLDLRSDWNVQGAMLYNGKEYLFNDPETLWPTDLAERLDGNYSGSGWRVHWGGWYAFNPHIIIDGSFNFISTVQMTGSVTGTRNKIAALNIDALKNGGNVDELLDAERLNPSQLTLTQSIGWQEQPLPTHDIPDQFKVGIFYQKGRWAFYLSEQFDVGSYRLQYGDDFFEIDTKQQLNFYCAYGRFYTRLGLLSLHLSSKGLEDIISQSYSLPLPFWGFGYGRQLFQRVAIIGAIDILPVPGVNFGVQYQF